MKTQVPSVARIVAMLFIAGAFLLPVRDLAAVQGGAEIKLADKSSDPVAYTNWPIKTAGGLQFWTDQKNVGGWKIQENSETNHYRLIDRKIVRRAWGNFIHCQQELEKRIRSGEVQPANGRVVILLHGLMRTANSMNTLEVRLQQMGYATVNFTYASSRKNVSDHAAALRSVIDGLGNQVTDIYFVAHSLGNIVIRHYLHDVQDPISGQQGDSRICRIVMIGPPNQGSQAAQAFKNNPLFRAVAGRSGEQLGRKWSELAPMLATPKVEFGIIAGSQKAGSFDNPFVQGKDDFTVGTDETKLVGATDFLVHPLLHGTMMSHPLVLEVTVRFFEHGYFVSDAEQTPIMSY